MTCPSCSDIEMEESHFESHRSDKAPKPVTYTCSVCGYTETR